MLDANALVYAAPDVVSAYAGTPKLQAAEARILEQCRPLLRQAAMLDVGVGGGRTTAYFAPAVREYVGVDISPPMVELCRRTFREGHCRFEVADVRALSGLADGQFDFVLFSFNGLDYIGHEDRLVALQEIRRVARPGAHLCFSTHNLRAGPRLMSLRAQWNRHPAWLARNVANWVRWRRDHAAEVARRIAEARDGHALLNDGSHGCRLTTYYIEPQQQVRQLEPWFTDVQVFSAATGEELGPAALAATTEDWLYFLCRAR